MSGVGGGVLALRRWQSARGARALEGDWRREQQGRCKAKRCAKESGWQRW